jgi:hypothetical protein
MKIMLNVGCLDGQSLIEMNNLAFGYFPSGALDVAVYPAPVPQAPQDVIVEPVPATVEQPAQRNF